MCVYFWLDSPPLGQGLFIHVVSRSHTTTHNTRWDSSGRVIISSQRPLPDTYNKRDIHALGGIRTHSLNRRAVEELRLRLRGHWDRCLLLW
jgi:hypothetical protein